MVNNFVITGLISGGDFSKKIWGQNYSISSDEDSSHERADQIENNKISENPRSSPERFRLFGTPSNISGNMRKQSKITERTEYSDEDTPFSDNMSIRNPREV